MVEYRVLSSAMMKDIETLQFVWAQLSKAIKALKGGYDMADPGDIITSINESNAELAQKIIDNYNIL